MKKLEKLDYTLICFFIVCLLIYLGYPLLMGTSVRGILKLLLHISMAVSIQLLFCRVFDRYEIRVLPLMAAMLFGLWGTGLYYTSSHFINVTIWDLGLDYLSLAIACIATFGYYYELI